MLQKTQDKNLANITHLGPDGAGPKTNVSGSPSCNLSHTPHGEQLSTPDI